VSSCPGLALLGALCRRTRARPFWTFNKPNVERFIEKQGTWPARRGRDHLAALKRGEVDIAYGRQGDIAYSLEGEIDEEPQRTPNLKFKAPIVNGTFGSAFPTSGDARSPLHYVRVRQTSIVPAAAIVPLIIPSGGVPTGVCSPPHPGSWIIAPLRPHRVHRADRRSILLEASPGVARERLASRG